MNQPAQELMREKENMGEPESMPVEDLIGLLQEHPGTTVRVYASMGYAVLAVEPSADKHADPAPLALTEEHLPSLEAAIRAEGYRIMVDTETGEVKLERDEK